MTKRLDLDDTRKKLVLLMAQSQDPALSETETIAIAGEMDIITEELIESAAADVADDWGKPESFVMQHPELRARAAFDAGYDVGIVAATELAAVRTTAARPRLRLLRFPPSDK